MTLVIRSDKMASRSLGNAFGFRGPSDWALKLDFSQQEYRALIGGSRQNVEIDSYITCGRTSAAAYFDPLGRRALAESSKIRVGSTVQGGPVGLISEGRRRNVFNNPFAPATHIATLVFMPSNPVIVLTCTGSSGASVALTGDITSTAGSTTAGHTITATPGNPAFAFPVAGKSTWQFAYTVAGNVTEVGAWSMSMFASPCSPAIAGQSLGGVIEDELLHLNTTALSQLANLSAGTLVACLEATSIGRTGMGGSRIVLHAGNGGNDKYAGIGFNVSTSGAIENRITNRRRSGGVDTEATLIPTNQTSSKMAVAISWNAAQAAVAGSGKSTADSAMDALVPSLISVGGGWDGGWAGAAQISMFGVITALLYYPRKLSTVEIEQVTLSRT